MKRTIWYKLLILAVGSVVICFGWFFDGFHTGFCNMKNGIEDCIVGYSDYASPLLFLSITVIATICVLFFVGDDIFKKWLRFFVIWLVITSFFIIKASGGGGWMGFGLTKQMVAIFMGVSLVVISVSMIAYKHFQLKK